MMIRNLMLASVLTLGACSQPAAPDDARDTAPGAAGADQATAPAPDPQSPGNELPVAADLLAGAPLSGRWEDVGDGATVGVLFTSPDYADTLAIGCNTGSGEAYINWTIQNPAEDGEVRLYTEAKTETFAATGTNAGAAIRTIDVTGSDPRLAVLKTTQAKFGVQASGEAIVVPWDPSIARVLNECAG